MKTSIISAALMGLPFVLALPTQSEDPADFEQFYNPAYNHNWQITQLEAGLSNVFGISYAIKDLNNSASAVHCGTYGREEPKDEYLGCSNGAFEFAYSSANAENLDPSSFILNIQQLDFSNPLYAVVKSGNFTVSNAVPGYTCDTNSTAQETNCSSSQTATVPYNIVPYYLPNITPAPQPATPASTAT